MRLAMMGLCFWRTSSPRSGAKPVPPRRASGPNSYDRCSSSRKHAAICSFSPPRTAIVTMRYPRSSRQRYLEFVRAYRERRLDEPDDESEEQRKPEESAAAASDEPEAPAARRLRGKKRRQYVRDYLRWLWPHRFGVGALLILAL